MPRACRRTLWYLALLVAMCVGAAPAAAIAMEPGDRAAAAGQFIVTLEDRADARVVAAEYRERGGQINHVYTTALNGFAGKMSEAAVAGLLRDSRVVRLERDGVATTAAVQSSPTWGLDRIDQRTTPFDKSYSYTTSGSRVHSYVIDTGIKLTHNEFTGRLGNGYDAITSGGTANDCNGHGTHVAGTVGGTTWGVAKATTLHPVRVLGCTGSGSWSGVIAGIDWVARNHVKPAVANLSLGGGVSTSVDDAVKRLIAAGVSTAVAAGNNSADACSYSPARVPAAVTVGATHSRDARASFSNYGSCLDLFAPGENITSADYANNSGETWMSGTSMASPHVAGAMARYLEANPTSSPSQVVAALTGTATSGVISSIGTGSPNLLLYMAPGAAASAPVNAAPAPGFTASCADLGCSFTDTSSDSDGTIASWSWNFGDKTSSTLRNPSHTYATGGTYTVTLTVTDNAGATATTSKSISVTAPSQPVEEPVADEPTQPDPSSIRLAVRGYKVKGYHHADLTWSGATTTSVEVYRGTTKITTTRNTGTYTDRVGTRGSGSYTYKVCEAGTSNCSNAAVAAY